MDKMNLEMDAELAAKTAALHANDDESGDGQIGFADLKLQLDRVEAQLDLQDKQNRRLLKNQRIQMIVSGIVIIALCIFIGVMAVTMNNAYRNILTTCTDVNELAGTLQDSISTLDTEQLNEMMQSLPEVVDSLSQIDVDSLNDVLTRLPSIMDTITALQNQVNGIANTFSGLGSLGGLLGGGGTQ